MNFTCLLVFFVHLPLFSLFLIDAIVVLWSWRSCTVCPPLIFVVCFVFVGVECMCIRGGAGSCLGWGGVGCCYIIERLGMLSCSRLLSTSVYDVFATQLMPS